MADFELFNGTNLEEPDSDHRIAMNKPSLAGSFFVRWDNFKNLIRSFTVSKDTDQSISGNKTFTGIVNVQVPTSDNNPVTLKYFNDNVGSEEIIEVATYANLPLVGVISVLYVVLDENVQYRWSGTVYIDMSSQLSYASQAEMEVTPAVENTKVVTPLRAWQGFMYWCTTSVFVGLSTTTKTIIGAINELKTNITALFASIRTKQDINVGFCELCPVLTSDVTRDWSTRTLTIQSTKGGTTVDATNPIRFFTKTSGAKKEWEKMTTQSVQWTDTKGLKYIYFDTDGTLKSQDTPWVIADITFVWRLYWNPAEVGVKKIVREAWECHTNSISSSDHVWKHKFGAIYLRGLDLVCNVIPTGAPNADGRNTCLSLTSGSCVDDNLQYDIINSSTPADFSQDMGVVVAASLSLLNGGIFDITYNTPDGTLTIIGGTRIPFHFVGNVPQVISAGGVISPVTNNYFFNYYLYSFQDPRFGKVVSLRSGGQYATQALANAETWEHVKAASPTLQDGEVRQLYQSQWEYRTSYDTAVKGAALRAFKTLRENAAVSVTAGSSSLLASNVVLTPPTGYASSTNVQIYADENAARVVKLESNETPAAIADTDNVRFKSATGYYVRTLLAIKNYVKLGLKASEVVNDSTNVTGPTVKAAFDNATLAIDGVTIQDGDLFPIAREVEAPAGVFKSVNMYHPWARIKNEIKDTCGTYYINTFEEFKTIVEDPLTPSDNIAFYLSNDNVFIMVGTITFHTENIYVKSQNTSVYLATLTINTTLIDTPNRIYFDGVCRIGDTEITLSIPSDTTSLHVKEIVCDEMYPTALNILTTGAGSFQYNNAINISRSRIQNDYQYAMWDAIRQDEKWAYSHYRTGGGPDLVGKTIAKVTGKSDAYGNFSIKVRYRLCYNESDLVLPLFPATLPHGKWVRFERCDYCRDKGRGDGGIYVTPRGFEVAKFYKGDSDLVITNGGLSNEAGAGGLYENQYDDTNTYLSTVVRSTLAQSTFKVKYTDSTTTDDNDTWIIVHLRGVIL